MTDKDKQKFDDLAKCIANAIKYNWPVTIQERKFLKAYRAMIKANPRRDK